MSVWYGGGITITRLFLLNSTKELKWKCSLRSPTSRMRTSFVILWNKFPLSTKCHIQYTILTENTLSTELNMQIHNYNNQRSYSTEEVKMMPPQVSQFNLASCDLDLWPHDPKVYRFMWTTGANLHQNRFLHYQNIMCTCLATDK